MTITERRLTAIRSRFDEFIQPTNWPILSRDPEDADAPQEYDRAKCWYWRGSLSAGYGRFSLGDRLEGAHRVAYWLWRGAIAPGMQIDHLCFHRSCVNPSHLEMVTPSENVRRSRVFPRAARQAWPEFRSAAHPRAQARGLTQ